MKKLFLVTISFLGCLSASAQEADYVIPCLVEYVVAQGLSADGKYVAGQDVFGAMVTRYNTVTGESVEFMNMLTGMGNCVSNTGVIVGQDQSGTDQHATVMMDHYVNPMNLIQMGHSSLEGITPDGTRAVGYMTDLSSSVMFVPVYNHLTETWIGPPRRLPYPERDPVKGGTPQCVKAICVSDDGKTIGGLVTDGDGFFDYPIVFRMDKDGETEEERWSYIVPKYVLDRPNDHLTWVSNMAISPDGKTLFLIQARNSETGASTVIDNLQPYVYDIENDIMTEIPTDVEMLIPLKAFDDGTLMAVTYYRAFMPSVTYIKEAGSDSFIPFTQYIMEHKPAFYPWIEDTLGQYGVIGYDDNFQPIYGDYIISGQMYVSNDMNVIASGYPFGDGFTYVFSGSGEIVDEPAPEPGTDAIGAVAEDTADVYTVYNLTGTCILSNGTKQQVLDLPKGLYIVNGSKQFIKN